MLKLTETDEKTIWFRLWKKNKSVKYKNLKGVWQTDNVQYPLIYDDSRFHVAYEKLTAALYLPYRTDENPDKCKPLVIDYDKARELYRDSTGAHIQLDIFSDWKIEPEQKPERKKSKKKVNDVKAIQEIMYDTAILKAVEKYKKGDKLPKGLYTLARKFLGEIE